MKQNRLIAITGGIGSGKSTVSEIFKLNGINTFSCDEIIHSLYKKRKILNKIKKSFPSCVSGKLKLKVDKKELSKICFNNDKNYKTLCDILSLKAFNIAVKNARKYCVSAIEVPLLFEYGLQNYFDNVLVVKRNLNDRIESVKARSNLNKDQIIERINRQIDYDTYDFSKYTVIDNNKTVEELKKQIDNFIKSL